MIEVSVTFNTQFEHPRQIDTFVERLHRNLELKYRDMIESVDVVDPRPSSVKVSVPATAHPKGQHEAQRSPEANGRAQPPKLTTEAEPTAIRVTLTDRHGRRSEHILTAGPGQSVAIEATATASAERQAEG